MIEDDDAAFVEQMSGASPRDWKMPETDRLVAFARIGASRPVPAADAVMVLVEALTRIRNGRPAGGIYECAHAALSDPLVIAAQSADPWLPIATAPRNNTPLLLCCASWEPARFRNEPPPIKVGGWDVGRNGWHIFGASWTPTHWMPLPAAPAFPQREPR